MTYNRYGLSFLLSLFISIIITIGVIYLLKIDKRLKAPKRETIIKVALLSPLKPTVKKPIKKVIVPPTPTPPKRVVTPKPVVKKVVKHKPKPKKIKPKRVVKKVIKNRPKHKKIVKKIKHKRVVKKPKKVIKERVITYHKTSKIVKRVEPIAPPQPVVKPTIKPTKKIVTPPKDNGMAKLAFLREVRNQIVANKRYPKLAYRRHIEGSVKVRFDITAQGEVNNIRFINGKSIFQKSIRRTLQRTFPISIPPNMRGKLPISDISVVLHFNIQ